MFAIARRIFIGMKILGTSTGKVGNLDEKNTAVAQQCIIIYIGCYWLIGNVCSFV